MLKIDLNPIKEFRYCQIPNHNFCYLLLNENLQAIHSPFTCKDYIQDIFYCEYTGNNAEIWGLHWTQGMLNTDVPFFKMAMMGGSENMQVRVPFMKLFLNEFEKALGISLSEVEETDDPNNIVVTFSKDWTVNGPLLSAFTTLIRISGAYEGGNALEYLKDLRKSHKDNMNPKKKKKTVFPDYMTPELGKLDTLIPRFAALLQGIRPKHDWNDFQNIAFVHNTGIIGFKKFPQVSVE